MAYHVFNRHGERIVLLRIKVEVATFLETQFSNINATDNNVTHGITFEDLKRVNITATKMRYVSRDDEKIFKEHQAECMIKTFLPIEFIENIDNPELIYPK